MEGEEKLLLPYREGTLVGAVVRVAATCLEPVVVVTGHRAEEVAVAARAGGGSGVRTVHNERFRAGQATSLARGMRAIRQGAEAPAAAVLLADEPGLRREAILRVTVAWREAPGSVARARYRDRPGHPVVFPRAAFPALERLEGDAGARELLRAGGWPVVEVELPWRAPRDVDTREDYAALEERERA